MSVVRCEAEQEHVRGSRSGRFAFCISVRVSYEEEWMVATVTKMEEKGEQ
jgi:hypothetical protein